MCKGPYNASFMIDILKHILRFTDGLTGNGEIIIYSRESHQYILLWIDVNVTHVTDNATYLFSLYRAEFTFTPMRFRYQRNRTHYSNGVL